MLNTDQSINQSGKFRDLRPWTCWTIVKLYIEYIQDYYQIIVFWNHLTLN